VIPPAQSFVRGRFLFSKARTFIPERPRWYAAFAPAGPIPIMMAS
jgi:hypothetical protein